MLAVLNSLELGGTQINAVDFARMIAAYGVETRLVGPRETLPNGPSLLDVAAGHGLGIEMFDAPRSTISGARMMADFASRYATDVIHVYSTGARAAFWGACLLGRRPLVVTLYEMQVSALTAARGAELIVGTRYLLEDIKGRQGGVHLISPPVDLDMDRPGCIDADGFLSEAGIVRDRPRIVIVSRLAGNMKALAIEIAMKAVARFGPHGPQLVVVGTGDAQQRLWDLAGRINADSRRTVVRMAGALADPRPAYACADVMIGMGGSAARSLAFAKPLVVSGEYGWFETFEPGTASGLFRNSFWSDRKSSDPEGKLFALLSPLIADERARRSLGSFGRAFAEENFGLAEMTRRLAGVYRKAQAEYGLHRWCADLPMEARFLRRKLFGERADRASDDAPAMARWRESDEPAVGDTDMRRASPF